MLKLLCFNPRCQFWLPCWYCHGGCWECLSPRTGAEQVWEVFETWTGRAGICGQTSPVVEGEHSSCSMLEAGADYGFHRLTSKSFQLLHTLHVTILPFQVQVSLLNGCSSSPVTSVPTVVHHSKLRQLPRACVLRSGCLTGCSNSSRQEKTSFLPANL